MANLKHVGRHKKNQRKCIVAYRVVPNEPDNCLVIFSDTLDSDAHDSVINLVESNSGQMAYEFAEAMHRNTLPDGRNMLVALSKTGKINKVPTADIEMIPNQQTSISLDELNKMVAEQKGVTVADLALQGDTKTQEQPVEEAPTVNTNIDTSSDVLTDEQLAAQYRSQADALYKEAKALRAQAEELVPTKRNTAKKTTTSSA